MGKSERSGLKISGSTIVEKGVRLFQFAIRSICLYNFFYGMNDSNRIFKMNIMTAVLINDVFAIG